jgi:hypothetical protein
MIQPTNTAESAGWSITHLPTGTETGIYEVNTLFKLMGTTVAPKRTCTVYEDRIEVSDNDGSNTGYVPYRIYGIKKG